MYIVPGDGRIVEKKKCAEDREVTDRRTLSCAVNPANRLLVHTEHVATCHLKSPC